MVVKTISKGSIWLLFIAVSSLSIPSAYAGNILSAGLFHVCGIKDDSTLECWGSNDNNRSTPPEGTFTQVSASYFNCAIRTDGTLACWGRDTAGETSPPQGYYKQVEVGGRHACALDENGVPKCWGNNDWGQIDALPGPFQQIALGQQHNCGLKADGTVECWGYNEYGQTDIPADTTFSSIEAGGFSTCGIKTDGIAICWGYTNKSYGYLTKIDYAVHVVGNLCGLKVDNTLSCPSMDSVPSDVFSYVTAGGNATTRYHYFACGIKADGIVACWGDNDYGRATPPEDVVFVHEVIPSTPSFTQADLDATYEASRQACIADPASCGIVTSAEPEIAAVIGTDLSLHVSKAQYKTLTGTQILWIDLTFGGQNEQGDLIWILSDYGEVK
jgi:alpha-tubulin suppressor-like RCC1 family protein